MQTDHPEEMLYLVDDADVEVGSISRAEVYANGIQNYRVIHAFICNDEGALWIPRRTKTKKLFPLALDYSVAGHVAYGESYEETLIRETAEEVNLDLTDIPYQEIGHIGPAPDGVCAWQKVYEITYNDTPDYNRDDICESYWLTPTEALDMIAAGEPTKSDLGKLIKKYYG